MSAMHPLPTFDTILTSVVLKQIQSDKEQPVKANWDFGNGARLELLGESSLNHALTVWAFHQTPALNTSDIVKKRQEMLSDDNLRAWENAYDLKTICNTSGPIDIESLMDDPKEILRFFYRLLGALEFKQGQQAVYNWVLGLIDPDSVSSSPQNIRNVKVEPSSPAGMPQQSYMSQPPQFAPATGSSPTHPTGMILAALNQKASQSGLKVEYPAESTGPPHNPTWAVRCVIDGKDKGMGRGKSQKGAKEQAATQAWQTMGW